MAVKLITAPADPVLTLAQAKAHLRVDHNDEDDLITALVLAATANVETFTGRALIDQTWELVLDSFPDDTNLFEIEIPKPPLIEVVRIAYDDELGDEQVMAAADYFVDNASEPGWVVPASDSLWPATLDAINTVRIRF